MLQDIEKPASPPDDALVRLSVVLEHIPVSRSTFYAWQAKGLVPKSIAVGPRIRAYRWSTVKAWLADPQMWEAINAQTHL